MFLGLPALTLMTALVALRLFFGLDAQTYPAGLALGLYLTLLFLHLAPKLAGFLDIALAPGGLRRYGGGPWFAAGCLLELGVSFLTGAVTTFCPNPVILGLPLRR